MKLSRPLVFALLATLAAAAMTDSSAMALASSNKLAKQATTTGDRSKNEDKDKDKGIKARDDQDSQDPSLSQASLCALIKCSDTGDGVCGSDGKTYPNACQLTAASCSSPGLTQVSDGPCAPVSIESPPPRPRSTDSPECEMMCARNYDPVCDTSGNVYGNACVFASAQCKDPKLQLGACASTKCPLPQCAPIEKPVCASNGRTYMNRCLLSYSMCKNKSLYVVHDGECGSVDAGPSGAPAQSHLPDTETPPTGCTAVSCQLFTKCRVDERTGRGYCADVCAPQRCPPNERCMLETVQCVTTPCPPIAKCVKRT